MSTPSAKKPPGHDLSSAELTKSYVISLLIAIPLLAATVAVAHYHANLNMARTIFWIVLFVSIGNFLALIALEQFRSQTGSFTIPALLTALALSVLVILVEGISRFIPIADFHWLYPVISLGIIFKYLALFKEKNLALKFYLAANIIALAALCSLSADDKLALPF